MSEPTSSRANWSRLRIGNDVVDLEHPRCRTRPPDDRLPRRILTSRERAWLEEAPDEPSRLRRLWSLWAAKETAFKVVSKLRGTPPVFRHRAFRSDLSEERESPDLVRLAGTVEWDPAQVDPGSSSDAEGHSASPPTVTVRVEGVATGEFVHLVGWNDTGDPHRPPCLEAGVEGRAPGSDGPLAESSRDPLPGPRRGPLFERERRVASKRARQVAQARLGSYLVRGREDGGPAPDITIRTSAARPGRTPPRVAVDGRLRPDLDLSLSHHGRYVGWAFLVPPEIRPSTPADDAGLSDQG